MRGGFVRLAGTAARDPESRGVKKMGIPRAKGERGADAAQAVTEGLLVAELNPTNIAAKKE